MSAKYSRIISTGSALPAARITNEDLARRLAADGIETSDEWIRTRTGIEARRFVNGTTETTTTLAAAAAQKALEGGGVDPKTIDLIIVATTTPDQVFPSTAAAVQRLIGAAGCAAFDVQAVCAGFIYALNAADAMLRQEVHSFGGLFQIVQLRPMGEACTLLCLDVVLDINEQTDLSVVLFRLAGRSGTSGDSGGKGFFGVVHPQGFQTGKPFLIRHSGGDIFATLDLIAFSLQAAKQFF